MNRSATIAAFACITAVALLSGCSASTNSLDAPTSPASQVEFFGAWSVIDADTSEPALIESPATIPSNGSIELIYIFPHKAIVETYLSARAGNRASSR